MSYKPPRPKPSRSTSGLKPDALTIDGDREDAVKKSLAKKKPLGGWPKLRSAQWLNHQYSTITYQHVVASTGVASFLFRRVRLVC